jgi:hypothetical protein
MTTKQGLLLITKFISHGNLQGVISHICYSGTCSCQQPKHTQRAQKERGRNPSFIYVCDLKGVYGFMGAFITKYHILHG